MTGCMDGQGVFAQNQNHTAKSNFMLSIYHFDDVVLTELYLLLFKQNLMFLHSKMLGLNTTQRWVNMDEPSGWVTAQKVGLNI